MKQNYLLFAQLMKSLLLTFLLISLTTQFCLAAKDKIADKDSLLALKTKKEKMLLKATLDRQVTSSTMGKAEVKLIHVDSPIIIRKGELLVIDLADKEGFYQVRIHTSLGRLMKKYVDVQGKIAIRTNLWEAGVYTVVISNEVKREIRKVLITE